MFVCEGQNSEHERNFSQNKLCTLMTFYRSNFFIPRKREHSHGIAFDVHKRFPRSIYETRVNTIEIVRVDYKNITEIVERKCRCHPQSPCY